MCPHWFEEHTGEVAARLEGKDLSELFVEGARALADLMGTPRSGGGGAWERIALEATDREALLVDWLNELIAHADVAQRIYPEVVVERISDRALQARVRGWPVAVSGTAVKAATFHGLRIVSGPDRVTATVILDV